MLEHVVRRFSPQVGRLAIATGPEQDWALPDSVTRLNPSRVEDDGEYHRGPLAGLAAGLAWCDRAGAGDWLLVAPCDAPFLPGDLGERLLGAALDNNVGLAMAAYQGRPQPTFSLWRLDVLPTVTGTLASGDGPGLMTMADAIPHVRVDWPAGTPPAFFNVNTPADLAQARDWLDPGAAKA